MLGLYRHWNHDRDQKMHHVDNLTERGKKLERKGSCFINTMIGKRVFYSIYPFSSLVRRDPRCLHPCLLSSWLSLMPAAYSAFLRACTHLFSPPSTIRGGGRALKGRANVHCQLYSSCQGRKLCKILGNVKHTMLPRDPLPGSSPETLLYPCGSVAHA